MEKRSKFTKEEASHIKNALDRCRSASRDEQKTIRENELRKGIGFYISHFTSKRTGFTSADFDDLIQRGIIEII